MENSNTLILSIEPLKFRTRLYKSWMESNLFLLVILLLILSIYIYTLLLLLLMLLCIFIFMNNIAMENFISKIEYVNDIIVFTYYDAEMKCKTIDFPIHEMSSRYFNSPKGFTGVFLQIERNGKNIIRQYAVGEWSPDLIEEINKKLNSILKTQIENKSSQMLN